MQISKPQCKAKIFISFKFLDVDLTFEISYLRFLPYQYIPLLYQKLYISLITVDYINVQKNLQGAVSKDIIKLFYCFIVLLLIQKKKWSIVAM